MSNSTAIDGSSLPQIEDGHWAIVEVFGHRRHVGRLFSVEQWGMKLMRVDELLADGSNKTRFLGSGAIFCLTLTSEAEAREALLPANGWSCGNFSESPVVLGRCATCGSSRADDEAEEAAVKRNLASSDEPGF